MSATLDRILAAAERLTRPSNVWVLFVALEKKVAWAPQPEIPWRKVLLFRHTSDPQLWGLPGGAVAGTETPEQAARRWAETQTAHDREGWATVLGRSTFVDSIDLASGRIFVAPVDMEPLERLRATNSETFWAHSDFARETPREIHHPAALAAFDRIDSVNLQPTHSQGKHMATSRSEFIEAQSRATRLLQAFGDSDGADPFVPGEGLLQYRARLASQFQKYAPKFKGVDLNRISDANAFSYIEDGIYADAAAESARPTSRSLRPDELRAIQTPDASGRMLTRYVAGSDGALWDKFNPPIRYARRFLAPGVSRV